ncbi:MAG: hypothetical protein NZ921_04695 [Candidatus Caldarchaeum sp.]|nr:hypothetical protein [Candidatus Caldarchaeum sp.]
MGLAGKPFISTPEWSTVGLLGDTVTVSVKIPRVLRQKMKQLGIKPSEVLRKAIEKSADGKF